MAKIAMGIIPAGEAQVRQSKINILHLKYIALPNAKTMNELKKEIREYEDRLNETMKDWKKRFDEKN